MPFTGSTFSRLYSWVSDRDANINILAQKMDEETDGMVSAINQIMSGSIPFTGALKGTGGSASAPAFSFSSDTNTGMYRLGPDQLGFSVNGTEVLRATVNYITPSKQLNVDLSGNVFNGSGNHGIFVKSFSPTVTFVDKTSGSGSAQWQFNADTMRLIVDTDNDENIGADSNNSDENILLISTNFFSYKGNTIWHSGNDGSGSNMDADLLDGQHGDYYRDASNINSGTVDNNRLPTTITRNTSGIHSGTVTGNVTGNIEGVSANNFWHSGNDGVGSGLNSDLLDGQHGSYYQNASNLNAGTISDARLPSTITSSITGNASTATTASNSNNLDGQNSSYYRNASNINSGTLNENRLPNIPFSKLPSRKSWVPSGVTSYTPSDCVYVDYGEFVIVSFRVVLTSDFTIGNFPFSPATETGCIVFNTFGSTGNISDLTMFAQLSGTIMTIQNTSAGDGDTITGTITYIKN